MTDGQGGFYIRWASNKQYYFVLKAGNGQVLMTSETYTTKQAAKNGIASVIANVGEGTVDMTN